MQHEEALILADEICELSRHFELVDRRELSGVAILNRHLFVVRSNGRFAELARGLSPRPNECRRLDDFIPEVADEVEHICRLVLDSGRDMREVELSISRALRRADWLLDCRPVQNERPRPVGVCLRVRGAAPIRRSQARGAGI